MQEQKYTMNNKNSSRYVAGAFYGVVFLILAIIGGTLWWKNEESRVYIENSTIQAPVISISSATGGRVDEVYVTSGEEVQTGQPLARVNTEVIQSKGDGVVISTPAEVGSSVTPGQAIITMIHPQDLRVVGRVQENKGLTDIHVGQKATFTVDAFGSQKYEGVVEEVSSSARTPGLAFNISEKRSVQEFEVKVRYSGDATAAFKQGMSAKLWVFKN